MIEIPYASEWVEDKRLTKLYFHHQSPVLAHCRGAIAWPTIEGAGYAVMAGQIIPDGHVVVWEGYEFNAVLPVFKGDVQAYCGLADFLLSNWTRYRAQSYYWGGDQVDIHKHYSGLIYSAPVIQPPPVLIEVKRWNDDAADTLFDEAVMRGGLIINAATGLRQHVAAHDPEKLRGYHALRCLVCGFSRFPYVE